MLRLLKDAPFVDDPCVEDMLWSMTVRSVLTIASPALASVGSYTTELSLFSIQLKVPIEVLAEALADPSSSEGAFPPTFLTTLCECAAELLVTRNAFEDKEYLADDEIDEAVVAVAARYGAAVHLLLGDELHETGSRFIVWRLCIPTNRE